MVWQAKDLFRSAKGRRKSKAKPGQTGDGAAKQATVCRSENALESVDIANSAIIDHTGAAGAGETARIIDTSVAILEPAKREAGCDRGIDWRLKDHRIIELVRTDPRTTQQIYAEMADIIPRYDSLCRRLNRLRRKGRIRHQGTIQQHDVGRPSDWYCSWSVPRGKEMHELDLTNARDSILGEWRRGRLLTSDVSAEKKHLEEQAKANRKPTEKVPPLKVIWPDAILIRGSIRYYVEFDSGAQSEVQLREKFKAYESSPYRLLFITKETTEHLKHVARYIPAGLEERVLLTTLDLVMLSERDEIWYGVTLKTGIALPMSVPETPPETVQETRNLHW